MRKFRLQPLAAFRARTRFLRVVGGSCSFGVAGKKLALAGRKLKHFPGDGLALSPFFTQHKDTKREVSWLLATVLVAVVLGSYVDVHRAGASNSRAEIIQ